MDKLIALLDKYLVPIAGRIGSQKHLVAIRDGFVSALPLILIGSIAVLVNNLPFDWFQDFMKNHVSENWQDFGNYIWNATFAIFAIFIAFSVAYNLAKEYEVDELSAGFVSLSAFLLLSPLTEDGTGIMTNWIGSKGLFVAIFVAVISTEIFRKLIQKNWVIKMPAGVPPAVAKPFMALIPAGVVLVLMGSIQFFFAHGLGTSSSEFLYSTLQKPFQSLADSLPAVIFLQFSKSILWFFGLHGSNILSPIVNSVYLPNLEENIAAFQQGVSAGDLPNIATTTFFDVFVSIGGTGNGLGLLFAILIAARQQQLRGIGKLAAPGALFNINEPIMFGIPVVLNPILFIPYMLTPMVLVTISYLATAVGLVPHTTALVPFTTPVIIGGYLATGGSIAGAILQIVNVAAACLIYLPFIKAQDLYSAKQNI
ncbi:PTS cellobiose transporter subunit IIC [Peribacillus deserti]|uniref:Permease IIC component n=1 Tax=Peribacillus deserti TaxID=673318 RepID=A0A2N5M2H6_9BACI|nr:PTS cellobiose transporter subunit IIC [Peribacillus deserti]PLT28473.1 PTS system, cellobiose-specific IIC component [Peribacillus deserti]